MKLFFLTSATIHAHAHKMWETLPLHHTLDELLPRMQSSSETGIRCWKFQGAAMGCGLGGGGGDEGIVSENRQLMCTGLRCVEGRTKPPGDGSPSRGENLICLPDASNGLPCGLAVPFVTSRAAA